MKIVGPEFTTEGHIAAEVLTLCTAPNCVALTSPLPATSEINSTLLGIYIAYLKLDKASWSCSQKNTRDEFKTKQKITLLLLQLLVITVTKWVTYG